jgi:hypothetical protein
MAELNFTGYNWASMCSSEPRSLISLLNAAKEQPQAVPIAAEFLTFGPPLSHGNSKKAG